MKKRKTITGGKIAMDRLYLVVPCYNEEEVLPETVRAADR